MSFLPVLSQIFGWVYFAAWSLSFYPQVYTNFRLKSVEGFHLDYTFLNISGYVFYSICYSVAFFGSNNPYNNYGFGNIQIQDLVFAYHSLILVSVIGLQSIFYKRGGNKLSWYAIGYAIFAWSSAIIVFILTQTGSIEPSDNFNAILYLGYLKLSISVIKYAPAVYWNYCRKSTDGFSIYAILLDFTGGVLSIGQNFVDLYDGTTSVINPVKFGLGNCTMIYDIILMIQHYVIYNKNHKGSKVDSSSLKMLDGETSIV